MVKTVLSVMLLLFIVAVFAGGILLAAWGVVSALKMLVHEIRNFGKEDE